MKQAGDLFQTVSSTPNPLAKPQPLASQLCILASSDTISSGESVSANDDTVSRSSDENTLVQEDITPKEKHLSAGGRHPRRWRVRRKKNGVKDL